MPMTNAVWSGGGTQIVFAMGRSGSVGSDLWGRR